MLVQFDESFLHVKMLRFVDDYDNNDENSNLEQETHASLDVSDVLLKWFKLLEYEFHYRRATAKPKRKLFRPTAK